VVLFDIEIDGAERRGLAATGKTGWLYLLDRTNGEPLIGIEERPVPQESRQATAATQPHPVGEAFVPQSIDIAPEGFALVGEGRIFTPFWDEPVVFKPGALGGANWPPSSYDPQNGIYYVCANDSYQSLAYSSPVNNESPVPGEERIGGSLASAVELPTFGILAALDVRTNKLVWQQHWSDTCYSGSAVTASGLLFVGRNDGRFTALDSRSGERLWQFQTGAGVNAPPAIFEHDGTQYVAVYSAGNLFARSPRGDSVWLFSLAGTLDPVGRPPATAVGAIDRDIPGLGDSSTERGQLVYTQTCASCHGAEATGGHSGPALTGTALDAQSIAAVVLNGRNAMPGFGRLQLLTDQEIGDVTAYVLNALR
jgi:glucose dehydrogenase/cytochrome c5